MASGREFPTELPADPAVPGFAGFLFRHLKGPGHDCGHFPKYRAATGHEYPSRLGFFHSSRPECIVVYLDTSKLCKSCLDLVVPLGYNYWSILSVHNQVEKGKPSTTTQEPGSIERQKRWLDAPPSALRYPEFTQARAEQLPSEDSTARANVDQGPTIPTRVSIPQLPWASEAWQWLSSQRKPFYIDQLHMIKGWTPLAETMAERDFETAQKTGISFIPATEGNRSKMSKSTRATTKVTRPADNAATSTAISDKTLKATKTTKTTRKKSPEDSQAPDPTVTIPAGHSTESRTTEDLPISLSMGLSKKKISTSRAPKDSSTSSPKSAKTDKPNPDLIKRSGEHTQGAKKSANTSSKLQKKPEPRHDEHVSTLAKINPGIGLDHSIQPVIQHTRNYNRYEPLPFDSPVKPASLGNYKRGVGAAVILTQSSPTRLPLELVLDEDYSSAKRSKDLLRGPEESANEEEILALVGSRGPRREAGPETNLGFIEAAVKAKSKVPAASKKVGTPSLSYDRPLKAEKPKSSVVATESPREKSVQKAATTFRRDRSPLHNDKPRNVGSAEQSRDKPTQRVPATSKTDKPSSQHGKPPKANTPKSEVVSPELPRDKSDRKVHAPSKTDKPPLQHDKLRKVQAPWSETPPKSKAPKSETPKSGAVSQKSPPGKSAQKTSKTGTTRSGEANAKKPSEKARTDDKASKKPSKPKLKRSDPASKQASRHEKKSPSNRGQGNKKRSGKSGDDPASPAAKTSGKNGHDANIPDGDGEGNSGVDQSEEVPSGSDNQEDSEGKDDGEGDGEDDGEGEGEGEGEDGGEDEGEDGGEDEGEDGGEEGGEDGSDNNDDGSENNNGSNDDNNKDSDENEGSNDQGSGDEGSDDDGNDNEGSDDDVNNDDGNDNDNGGSDNNEGSNDEGAGEDADNGDDDDNEGSNNDESDGDNDNDSDNDNGDGDGDGGSDDDNEGSNNDESDGDNGNDSDNDNGDGDGDGDGGSDENQGSDDNDNNNSSDNEHSDNNDNRGSDDEEGSNDDEEGSNDEGAPEKRVPVRMRRMSRTVVHVAPKSPRTKSRTMMYSAKTAKRLKTMVIMD
ncbi:hypothetical protein PG996_008820 [Apiospora saccharicola]|uniref:Uncharacterized protein n=1 Tax=Apiospora saccharicola TaxID=335842 RepID=A0ABR1UZ13_9PEZI